MTLFLHVARQSMTSLCTDQRHNETITVSCISCHVSSAFFFKPHWFSEANKNRGVVFCKLFSFPTADLRLVPLRIRTCCTCRCSSWPKADHSSLRSSLDIVHFSWRFGKRPTETRTLTGINHACCLERCSVQDVTAFSWKSRHF